MSSSKLFTLKASDGETFVVEEAAATKLEAIQNMMEESCFKEDDGDGELVIPLSKVNGRFLGMVLQWCKKHVNDENHNNKDDVKKWDEELVKDMDQATLYHLLMAADYLSCSGLVDLLTTKVANMIKGKKVEQIRQIFNIQNDFKPEEEEEIRKKNAWAFE